MIYLTKLPFLCGHDGNHIIFCGFCCHLPPICHHPTMPINKAFAVSWWQSGSKNRKIHFVVGA